MKKIIAFILIIVTGALLRVINVSPYLIYPDAYQNLLVAENVLKGSVLGTLGQNGLTYPPFFEWSRPGYPLFINAANLLMGNAILSAQTINILCGILAITLTFFLLKTLFRSETPALAGSALLALSFDHTVWSGFVATEALGVFLLLLFLLIFFRNQRTKPVWSDWRDFSTGFVLAIAVLTRYEYAFLILPLFFYLFLTQKHFYIRFLNIASVFVFILANCFYILFPTPYLLASLSAKLTKLATPLLTLSAFSSALIYLKYKLGKQKLSQTISLINYTLISLILATSTYSYLQYFLPNILTPFYFKLGSIRDFLTTDIILGATFLLGTVSLTRSKYKELTLFVLTSIGLLYFSYYSVNPQMQRYITHLTPFLIIPASFFVSESYNYLRRYKSAKFTKYTLWISSGVVVFLLTLLQISSTYQGLKNWAEGSFFEQSYTQVAAKYIKKGNNELLITSLPEPYYYFTRIPTTSVSNDYPFIYVDPELESEKALIINDMGMRDQFPAFSQFLDENLSEYKTCEFWVGKKYHYADRIEEESYPITAYSISINELKNAINSSNNTQ